MIYDLKNIKNHILHQPLYIIPFFTLAYLIFYISFLLNQNWYILLFSIFAWLSIIAIVSLLITHALILLIKISDEIPGRWRFLPFITIPLSYILMRLVFFFYPMDFSKSVSILVTILLTIIVVFLLLKYKTNKFKTKVDMKSLKKLAEEETNGPRRLVRE